MTDPAYLPPPVSELNLVFYCTRPNHGVKVDGGGEGRFIDPTRFVVIPCDTEGRPLAPLTCSVCKKEGELVEAEAGVFPPHMVKLQARMDGMRVY